MLCHIVHLYVLNIIALRGQTETNVGKIWKALVKQLQPCQLLYRLLMPPQDLMLIHCALISILYNIICNIIIYN